MRCILMPRQDFESKEKVAYVKIPYIGANGTTGEIFTTKRNFDKQGFDSKNSLTDDEVKELFKSYKASNVDFDNKGQLVGLAPLD